MQKTPMLIGRDISSHFDTKPIQKKTLPEVISHDRAIDLLRVEVTSKDQDKGLQTPWQGVNHLVKGFLPGDLIILSAPPKTGKTTFALNISTALAFQGHPILFYCLEMRPERLARKIIEAKTRKETLSINDINQASRDHKNLPFYYAHSFKKQPLGDILALIKSATRKYKFDFVVFDNIHFLIRSISNVNEELAQAIQGFKLLAEDLAIPIMTIAQPRKRERADRDEIMRADDIKYSNAIHADCDQMILMHRRRIASKAVDIEQYGGFTGSGSALDPITLIRIEAHRFGSGGEGLLYFHGEYSKFDSLKS